MTTPPAGWYPDPASSDNIRYWDGQTWTDQTQARSAAPPPPPPGPPPIAPAPGVNYPNAGFVNNPVTAGMQQTGPFIAPPLADPRLGTLGPDGQVLAGWWRRAAGLILDSIIIAIPTALVTIIAIFIFGGDNLINNEAVQSLVDRSTAGETVTADEVADIFGSSFVPVVATAVVASLVFSIINGVVLVARSGQTLGDRVVKTRKVMAGRTVPSGGVALFRWLIPQILGLIGGVIPFIGFLLQPLDYLWAAWDKENQTIHDKIVKTYVERADLTGPPMSRP